MKLSRTYLFIIISCIALLIVLIIQVNWIFQTAKIKEEIFNDKANLVLSKTAEVLSIDTAACRNMEECMGKDEMHKTDSLFTNYMKAFDFHLDYSFEVKNAKSNSTGIKEGLTSNVYKKILDEEASKNGLELNLFLPGKKQFIVEEMSTMFITSVILILIVLFMFWRTIKFLMNEKNISEHTTDFLNNMTHEFKTPLTNIALAGKMISKESSAVKEDRILHYSGIILEENEKLRLQVEQVLSMTALERGEIPIKKSEIDLHSVIEETVRNIRIQIDSREGEINMELKANNSLISGDRTHLINALSNLIDNGIKYSIGKPKIFIETKDEGSNIVIFVSDKGKGIEKKYQKKVFDKYFRVPKGDVHDVKGFGLGLAYIKKIIQMHDGNIALDSEIGKGTKFTITLPHG